MQRFGDRFERVASVPQNTEKVFSLTMDHGGWLEVHIENPQHVAAAAKEMADPYSKFKDVFMYCIITSSAN